MTADEVVDLAAVRHRADQLHGQAFRVVEQDVEGVWNFGLAVAELPFSARSDALLREGEANGTDHSSDAVDEQIAIGKGLAAGETVVVEAGYGLPDGSEVRLTGDDAR